MPDHTGRAVHPRVSFTTIFKPHNFSLSQFAVANGLHDCIRCDDVQARDKTDPGFQIYGRSGRNRVYKPGWKPGGSAFEPRGQAMFRCHGSFLNSSLAFVTDCRIRSFVPIRIFRERVSPGALP